MRVRARKWVAVQSGGPEALRSIEADVPEPGPGHVSDVSPALVPDRARVVTIAAAPRAKADGYVFIGASNPESGPFRARARSRVLALAQRGDLVVPIAATFPFEDAPAAFTLLMSPHLPGKVALTNEI